MIEKENPKLEEVKEEEERPPEGDDVIDTATVLGLLTASCQKVPKEKREVCWHGIEPLHRGAQKPLEVLTEHFYQFGAEEGLEKAEKRLHWLVKKAKEEAQKRLELEGKIKSREKE